MVVGEDVAEVLEAEPEDMRGALLTDGVLVPLCIVVPGVVVDALDEMGIPLSVVACALDSAILVLEDAGVADVALVLASVLLHSDTLLS